MTLAIEVTPEFRIMPDGREICGTHGKYRCKEGVREYKRRLEEMRVRQGGRCCLEGHAPMCPGILYKDAATFEHENGRGASKRDDRTVLPNGKWINGAAHWSCNQWKGSRRVRYNR